MATHRPNLKVVLLLIVSTALFLGLAAWGWGDWTGLLAHPARAGACLLMVLSTIAVVSPTPTSAGSSGRTPTVAGSSLLRSWSSWHSPTCPPTPTAVTCGRSTGMWSVISA